MVKKRKRTPKRISRNVRLAGRTVWYCRQCYPEKIAVKDSRGLPLEATIYVGEREIKYKGMVLHKFWIAWCAKCENWLAVERKYGVTVEPTDVAHKVSDGQVAEHTITFRQFIAVVDKVLGWPKELLKQEFEGID